MILVTINTHVLSAKRREFLHTVRELTSLLRKTQGCQRVQVYRDLECKNTFCIMEQWAEQESVDAHIGSHAFRALLGAIQLLTESSNITVTTVSQISEFEHIQEGVRQ